MSEKDDPTAGGKDDAEDPTETAEGEPADPTAGEPVASGNSGGDTTASDSLLQRIVLSQRFDTVVVLLIIASSASMIGEDPTSESVCDGQCAQLELMFTVLFTAEIAISVAALGPVSFLKSGWRQ